jgi:hypothetical protein
MAATSPHSEWTFDAPRSPGGLAALDPPPRAINRYYRAPLARLFVRGLARTPITADLLTFVQPLLAAVAGYFLTFSDTRHLVFGVLLFEVRAILAFTALALARTQQKPTPDSSAGWLSLFFLIAGLAWHFHLHPPSGAWSEYLVVNGVLVLALLLLNGWFIRSASRPTAPAPASSP